MVIPQAGPQPFIIGGYVLFFFYSVALTHLLRRHIRRREWLALNLGRAGVRLLVAAVIVATIQAALIVVVQCLWTQTPLSAASGSFFLLMWGNTTAAMCVWTALYAGSASLVRGRRLRQDAIALELGMREARLKALEAQIGPHFLFNCLNSLRGLILENPLQAQDMVTRLANILRHNLARDSHPSEPLGAQVEFTADYLALESIRFEERLRTRFEIEPDAQTAAVPAMLLQTLVENAVKHGISHLPAGGEVIIRAQFEADELVITVENTGRLVESPRGSTRVGIANLRERLRVLHGPAASLELAETPSNTVRATVRIPRDGLD
jgi:LytS/YehU family sensor histidine kinase